MMPNNGQLKKEIDLVLAINAGFMGPKAIQNAIKKTTRHVRSIAAIKGIIRLYPHDYIRHDRRKMYMLKQNG